ncbi:Hypothetical protein, putative [Bodo saltans]|uniref:Uncharacterized protein n=1 Tax=Bodo saltans TaxID=75058 RepID=A0A0S4ISX8_BODSA|nr:Hypothetical protein, putative [Bodo saltans]|eukprot:CUF66879.1 Hypothetical protein, putative [Bodo saltans]
MSHAQSHSGGDFDLLMQWGDPAALIAHRLLQGAARAVLSNLWDLLHVRDFHNELHADGGVSIGENGTSSRKDRPVTVKDYIDAIMDRVGRLFDPNASGIGSSVQSWMQLWLLLPMSALSDLVSSKMHHVVLLLERHLRRPLWTVLATFVRRAVGDVAMQLQVVISVLHVALITLTHFLVGDGNGVARSLQEVNKTVGQSNHTVSLALESFFTQLQEAGAVSHRSQEHSTFVELFFGISDAMQLHTSDYLRLLQESGELLAHVRDDVQTIAARVRVQGPQQGSSNQERDEFFQASGQFHAQLQTALQFHRHAEFLRLVEAYGVTTVRPYSCIAQRNEGLSQQHIHLLNACYSPVVVMLLTSYHNTTHLVAQYKQQIDARNATVKSQTALSQLLVGAQLLEEQNKSATTTVEEVITHCDALQTLLKTIHSWSPTHSTTQQTSLGGGVVASSDEAAPSVPHRRLAPGLEAITMPPVTRGRNAERLFLFHTLKSVDAVVDALSTELGAIVSSCAELKETSQHLLDALHGLRHDQSTTLFPLGQLAAKVLREVEQLQAIVEQEARFMRPQLRGDDAGASPPLWEHFCSLRASVEAPLLPVAARRALMVLASTVATLHDACCLIVPALVIVQETMSLHLEVVRKEQQGIAFEVVELHEALSLMQSQSIRIEEASGNGDGTISFEQGNNDDTNAFLMTLKDATNVAVRTGQTSALDITFVSDVLMSLQREDSSVAAQVHSVVSGLRDTSDAAAKRCFDSVACYCTVVELLSKSIFPSSTSSTGGSNSRSGSVVAPRQLSQTPTAIAR